MFDGDVTVGLRSLLLFKMRQFLVLPSNPHFVTILLKGVVSCLSVVRFVNHANAPPYSLWDLRNYLQVFKTTTAIRFNLL